MATGEPVGEPEMFFCPMITGNAVKGIGSITAPTTCIRPFGANDPMSVSQSSGTLTVTISRSKVLAKALIAAESRLETT